MGQILGRDIKEGTRIKTWFMPMGTSAISIETYNGPLAYLFPNGAKIIGFNAATRSGSLSMTCGNDELFETA